MKTLLELIAIYIASVLFNVLVCLIFDYDYTEAATLRGMVIWYAIQWIEYRRSLPEKQNQNRDDQKG